MTYEGIFPVGTVVRLKKVEDQDFMITGYCVRSTNEPSRVYDYCACPHPTGLMSPDQNVMFNHDQIERVRAVGFISEASYVVIPEIEKLLAKIRSENQQSE